MFEYVTLFSVPFVRNAFVYQILHEKEIRSTYEINKFSVENSLKIFIHSLTLVRFLLLLHAISHIYSLYMWCSAAQEPVLGWLTAPFDVELWVMTSRCKRNVHVLTHTNRKIVEQQCFEMRDIKPTAKWLDYINKGSIRDYFMSRGDVSMLFGETRKKSQCPKLGVELVNVRLVVRMVTRGNSGKIPVLQTWRQIDELPIIWETEIAIAHFCLLSIRTCF